MFSSFFYLSACCWQIFQESWKHRILVLFNFSYLAEKERIPFIFPPDPRLGCFIYLFFLLPLLLFNVRSTSAPCTRAFIYLFSLLPLLLFSVRSASAPYTRPFIYLFFLLPLLLFSVRSASAPFTRAFIYLFFLFSHLPRGLALRTDVCPEHHSFIYLFCSVTCSTMLTRSRNTHILSLDDCTPCMPIKRS